MKLSNNVAVVSGGVSGLGEACVEMLAGAACQVGILDINDDKGHLLEEKLGSQVRYFKTDVSDPENVKGSIQSVCDCFGKLNFVINCAGINKPMKVLGRGGSISLIEFNRIVEINLTGTMAVLAAASEQIAGNIEDENGERGVIINTSSIAAYEGQVGQAAYSASKAGIIGMTLPVAREFADYGIRVNTIAPGLFETPLLTELPERVRASLTDQIPFPRRLGKPEEFASLVRHIIENPLINGETIRIDSAMRMGAT